MCIGINQHVYVCYLIQDRRYQQSITPHELTTISPRLTISGESTKERKKGTFERKMRKRIENYAKDP